MARRSWAQREDELKRTDFKGQLDLLTGEALSTDVVKAKTAPAPTLVEETGAVSCPTSELPYE